MLNVGRQLSHSLIFFSSAFQHLIEITIKFTFCLFNSLHPQEKLLKNVRPYFSDFRKLFVDVNRLVCALSQCQVVLVLVDKGQHLSANFIIFGTIHFTIQPVAYVCSVCGDFES